MPMAAVAPTRCVSHGPPPGSGCRSGSPLRLMCPASAQCSSGPARHADFGPVNPYGVMAAATSWGCASRAPVTSACVEARSPWQSSTKTSKPAANSASGAPGSRRTLVVLARKYSHATETGPSPMSSTRDCRRREPSGGSPTTTSAPVIASIRAQYAPARPSLRSSTRTPRTSPLSRRQPSGPGSYRRRSVPASAVRRDGFAVELAAVVGVAAFGEGSQALFGVGGGEGRPGVLLVQPQSVGQ